MRIRKDELGRNNGNNIIQSRFISSILDSLHSTGSIGRSLLCVSLSLHCVPIALRVCGIDAHIYL